jgi:hypothetical protein
LRRQGGGFAAGHEKIRFQPSKECRFLNNRAHAIAMAGFAAHAAELSVACSIRQTCSLDLFA